MKNSMLSVLRKITDAFKLATVQEIENGELGI